MVKLYSVYLPPSLIIMAGTCSPCQLTVTVSPAVTVCFSRMTWVGAIPVYPPQENKTAPWQVIELSVCLAAILQF